MVKHTLKSLRYEHRKIFKVCLIISLYYVLENTTYIGLTSCFICYNNGFSEQKKCETLSSKTTISCTVTSSKNFLRKNYGIQDGKKIKNFPNYHIQPNSHFSNNWNIQLFKEALFTRKSLIKVSKSFICNNVIISYGVKILIYTFPPKGIALVSLFLSFLFNLVENQKRYKN